LSACFGLVAAPLLPTAVAALGTTELACGAAVEARGGNRRRITGHHSVLEPQVQAHAVCWIGEGQHTSGHLCLGHQAHVPVAAGVLLERRALGFTLDGLGEAQPHPSDLGHLDTPVDHTHTLWDAE